MTLENTSGWSERPAHVTLTRHHGHNGLMARQSQTARSSFTLSETGREAVPIALPLAARAANNAATCAGVVGVASATRDVQAARTGFPNSQTPSRWCSSSTRSGDLRARDSVFRAYILIHPSIRPSPWPSQSHPADADPIRVASAAACRFASSLPYRAPSPERCKPLRTHENSAAKRAATLVRDEPTLS